MMRWILLGGFITVLHGLFFISSFPLPTIFQIKPPTTLPIRMIWVKHFKDISIETPKPENPLEHAQAIIADLLETTLNKE